MLSSHRVTFTALQKRWYNTLCGTNQQPQLIRITIKYTYDIKDTQKYHTLINRRYQRKAVCTPPSSTPPSKSMHYIHKPTPNNNDKDKQIVVDEKKGTEPKHKDKHEHSAHESFLARLAHSHAEYTPHTKEALKVTYWGIMCNIALVVGKFSAGIVGHSAAMVADAAHSLTDLISDVVTLWALRISNEPRDANHPYGHGKFDSIGSLAVSGLLAATAIGIASHSVGHIGHAHEMTTQIALWAAVISIAAKETLYRVTIAVGKRQHSSVVVANAWHHRSDAFSSVVALVGIGGALAGFEMLDPIAGVAVAGLIMKTAIELGISSVRELTDETAADVVIEVSKVVAKTSGVLGYDDVRARKMGSSIFVDLRIHVESHLSVTAANQIVERVRKEIRKEIPHIGEVLVRVNPRNEESENGKLMRPQEEIEADVRNAVVSVPEILGISHFMAHYEKEKLTVVIDVIVDPHKKVTDVKQIAQRAKEEIRSRVKDVHSVDVHLELGDHTKDAE